MGTTSTTVTSNWTVVKNAHGFPTVVTGSDAKVYVNLTASPFSGEVWSDVDTMTPVPTGATITDLTFEIDVQIDGPRDVPGIACSPNLQFIDKGQYLAHSFITGYGIFGASGVGDLPNDNFRHTIDYANAAYAAASGGGGVANLAAFAAALANPSTPVILQGQGPLGGATGTAITYYASATLTFFWTGADTLLPSFPMVYRASPLRQHPRDDGLGTSSAPRIYPAPKSYQASNRRAGGYL